MQNRNILVDVTMNSVKATTNSLTPQAEAILRDILTKFVTGESNFQQVQQISQSIIADSMPIDRLYHMLHCDNTPLPEAPEQISAGTGQRKKNKTWTNDEDNRLIVGVYKFGTDSWSTVSNFVGNSRTRAQCSQRWTRVLDPNIDRSPWTDEENKKLKELVMKYGSKAWVKISSEMENRSDVQCRYHYTLLYNENPQLMNQPPPPPPDNYIHQVEMQPEIPPQVIEAKANQHLNPQQIASLVSTLKLISPNDLRQILELVHSPNLAFRQPNLTDIGQQQAAPGQSGDSIDAIGSSNASPFMGKQADSSNTFPRFNTTSFWNQE